MLLQELLLTERYPSLPPRNIIQVCHLGEKDVYMIGTRTPAQTPPVRSARDRARGAINPVSRAREFAHEGAALRRGAPTMPRT